MNVLRRLGSLTQLPPGPPPTVEEALGGGSLLLEEAGISTARLDAECLLGHVLGCPRWRLILASERRLTPDQFVAFLRLLQRRERREPLAYLVGGREFWSLPLAVSRDVLVPRPETETLVETALAVCRGELGAENREAGDGALGTRASNREPETGDLLIVDLCTGSGAIALALARELPTARVLATDISWRALRVARENAAALGLGDRVTFLRGHLWRALEGILRDRPADLVTANPPYIPSATIPTLMPELAWEPRRALDGGPDGLGIIREIIAGAPDRLRPGGVLLLEIGAEQGAATGELVRETGAFESWRVGRDLAGLDRVLVARRRG